jgi:hypothetical protein
MASRLADRLRLAREQLMVGRNAELLAYRETLEASSPPFFVLYVYGPGGIGKTTLLNEFQHLSEWLHVPVYSIDARNVEPNPDTFIGALQAAMGLTPPTTPLSRLAERSVRQVILIDTYENLAPLDEWLCKTFFPQVPENVILVLAGRHPPSPAWRSDAGWQGLIRVLPLRNLSPEESRAYLSKRLVPADEQPGVLGFTHGHPLALSLVADLYAQRPDFHFQPDESPDVVKTLLEKFVQKAPGPAHRTALEACALVHSMTEGLLAEMLAINESILASVPEAQQALHDIFEWLRSLSFIEMGRRGLFPHDLAREALIADLRWRNPDWYAELHHRARGYYTKRLGTASSLLQQQMIMDLIYLHRDNAVVRPHFEWQSGGKLLVERMQPGDRQILLEIIARHEGQESAALAAYWFSRQPGQVLVVRDAGGNPVGFVTAITMQTSNSADLSADPATQAAWNYLQRHAPLRPGEFATYFRFWMASDSYQDISPAQSLIGANMVRHYLTTPGLAYAFFPVRDAAFWFALMAYANLLPVPEASFQVGGVAYTVFGHDWRIEPPAAWLELLAEREISSGLVVTGPPKASQSLVVLSEVDFEAAVMEALRTFTRPDGIQGNPLLRSRLVLERTGMEAPDGKRSETLRELILGAAESLKASPKESKFYRAVYHTYFQPAPTQELAAELLDIPFSTYRRHLKSGASRIVEILWQKEIGAVD